MNKKERYDIFKYTKSYFSTIILQDYRITLFRNFSKVTNPTSMHQSISHSDELIYVGNKALTVY